MNGVLNIYKEKGMTSFGVVARLKRITGEDKIGHAGTLDPDAFGVLPVCFGKATKLIGQITDNDKEYHAVLLFGRSTDTLDISGKTIARMDKNEAKERLGNKENILKATEGFKGEIMQLPPMYSAVKVGGVKLVDAARRGQEIERKPRKAVIYDIFDINIADDLLSVSFTVSCSKGTYIRTLCDDIGRALGVPAAMGELERTRACGLGKDSAHTLSEVEEYKNSGRLDEILIGADEMLADYPSLIVKNEAVKRLIFGNFMYFEDFLSGQPLKETGIFRIYDEDGKFYGLYKYNEGEKFYRCEKMFVEQKICR